MTAKRDRHHALLLIGFLALASAILAAIGSPATGYELSIYAATPLVFWIGGGVAVVVGLLVAFGARPGTNRRALAIGLGVLAGLSVVSLPLLRGYYFHGAGDALSYLGWTRMMADGRLNPVGLMYPGIQSTAVFIATVTGMTLRRALMVVVPLSVALYLLFTGLTVARVAKHSNAMAVGTFLALCLLPINNVHTFIFPYPTSEAIFFTPFALYLLVGHLQSNDGLFDGRLGSVLSPLGLLLVLAGITAILIHPQAGSNVLLILGAGLLLQVIATRFDRFDARGIVTRHRSLAVPTLAVGAFFLAWTPRFDRVEGTITSVFGNLFTQLTPANQISSQATSLSLVGSSLLDLFLKLFLVSAILSLLAGIVMVSLATGRLSDRFPERNALLAYLAAGFVPVFGLFVLFLLASETRQPFRYFGFMMLFVTILAAVALSDGITGRIHLGPENRTAVFSLFFIALLVPQAAIIFQSPYILKSGGHVPEQRMDGYATTFEVRDPDVHFVGIRGGPRRYVDAHYGTAVGDVTPSGEVFDGKRDDVPFAVFGHNSSEFFSQCRYVPITTEDYLREVRVYEGLRYSAEAFRTFETNANVSRVQANGNYELYYLAGYNCGA